MKNSGVPVFFDHTILMEVNDCIATITLDCAENRNRINEQFIDEFYRAVRQLRYDDGVRAVIIRANGPTFFGGGDMQKLILTSMSESELAARQFMTKALAAVRELKDCGKPVIAAMDAPAVGGGCGFTLSCDIVFSTKNGGFQPNLHAISGLVPDCGGIYAFSRLCGAQKAMWYCLRRENVSAEEAYEAGLITKLFDDVDAMYDEAYGLAKFIASLPPYGVQGIKQLCNHADDMSFETYAMFEAENVANGVHTQDFKVVAEALAKGDPSLRVFKGY